MNSIPEFISLLRDIRDRMYVEIKKWYAEIDSWQIEVEINKDQTKVYYDQVVEIVGEIEEISVRNPTIAIPNKPDGTLGDGNVDYYPDSNEFQFSIPDGLDGADGVDGTNGTNGTDGADGKNMDLTYAVPTVADMNAIVGMVEGNTCFVQETGLVYTYLSTLIWGDGVSMEGATTFLALTDTPNAFTGKAGVISAVNIAEDKLEFTSVVAENIIQSTGGTMTDDLLFDNCNVAVKVTNLGENGVCLYDDSDTVRCKMGMAGVLGQLQLSEFDSNGDLTGQLLFGDNGNLEIPTGTDPLKPKDVITKDYVDSFKDEIATSKVDSSSGGFDIVSAITSLTQAEYDAIPVPIDSVLYVIIGD